MIKEETINSWEDFEKKLVEINEETKSLQANSQLHVSYPLFRGHSNSDWKLKSTLDRIRKEMSLSEYHHLIKIVHNHVETCTNREWNLETKVDLGEFNLPAYEFMAYLRHNGFPSPLLDWSQSPYIAAYFAFKDIFLPKQPQTCVSIFVYRAYAGQGRSWCHQKPHIQNLGPTIATDCKHYLQQSEYTICVEKQDGEIYFSNYEDVKREGWHDILKKYNIPLSEQQKVLRKLDSMNITAYSLFNSEPSLMETLFLRESFLNGK